MRQHRTHLLVLGALALVRCDGQLGGDSPGTEREAQGSQQSFTWAPGFSNDCRAFALPTTVPGATPISAPEGNGCSSAGGRFWVLSGTNEDLDFRNLLSPSGVIHMGDLKPRSAGEADSPWEYGFYPKGDGTYRVGWALDKINFPKYVDRHCGTFLNDGYSTPPSIDDDLVLELDARLRGADAIADGSVVTTFRDPSWDQVILDPYGRTVGDAKNRITVGVSARSRDGVIYFLEVNLYRTKNWDQIPDAADLYDRQASWDIPGAKGQVVYFNGARLSLVPGASDLPALAVEPDGPMRHFRVPISTLFKSYAWPYPVASWRDVVVIGTYVGPEIWGRGRLWFELENYRLQGGGGAAARHTPADRLAR